MNVGDRVRLNEKGKRRLTHYVGAPGVIVETIVCAPLSNKRIRVQWCGSENHTWWVDEDETEVIERSDMKPGDWVQLNELVRKVAPFYTGFKGLLTEKGVFTSRVKWDCQSVSCLVATEHIEPIPDPRDERIRELEEVCREMIGRARQFCLEANPVWTPTMAKLRKAIEPEASKKAKAFWDGWRLGVMGSCPATDDEMRDDDFRAGLSFGQETLRNAIHTANTELKIAGGPFRA